jgi:hypothetical protein
MSLHLSVHPSAELLCCRTDIENTSKSTRRVAPKTRNEKRKEQPIKRDRIYSEGRPRDEMAEMVEDKKEGREMHVPFNCYSANLGIAPQD